MAAFLTVLAAGLLLALFADIRILCAVKHFQQKWTPVLRCENAMKHKGRAVSLNGN